MDTIPSGRNGCKAASVDLRPAIIALFPTWQVSTWSERKASIMDAYDAGVLGMDQTTAFFATYSELRSA